MKLFTLHQGLQCHFVFFLGWVNKKECCQRILQWFGRRSDLGPAEAVCCFRSWLGQSLGPLEAAGYVSQGPQEAKLLRTWSLRFHDDPYQPQGSGDVLTTRSRIPTPAQTRRPPPPRIRRLIHRILEGVGFSRGQQPTDLRITEAAAERKRKKRHRCFVGSKAKETPPTNGLEPWMQPTSLGAELGRDLTNWIHLQPQPRI